MRLRVIALVALIVASLIVLSAAQAPDYAGKAKVVIKLTKMPDMPAMPQTESADMFGTTAASLRTPEVPQGTIVQGEVLYSSDPAVKVDQTYTLYIHYDPDNMPPGFQAGLVDKLKSGAVVGVDQYALEGGQMVVDVGTSGDWNKKIRILDMQYADASETKNPFLIDLGGFREFGSLPAFNQSMELKPLLNMSPLSLNTGMDFPKMQQSTGFFKLFSDLFR